MNSDKKLSQYHDYLQENGLKSTRQRDLIVEEFFREHEHVTVEDLWRRVKAKDSHIGYATVYRTLKLLTDSGLAQKREFGGGHSRFEQETDHHHDHLICLKCHQIIEFENEEIEKLQEKVCRKYRFKLLQHKMELYGYCQNCSEKN